MQGGARGFLKCQLQSCQGGLRYLKAVISTFERCSGDEVRSTYVCQEWSLDSMGELEIDGSSDTKCYMYRNYSRSPKTPQQFLLSNTPSKGVVAVNKARMRSKVK